MKVRISIRGQAQNDLGLFVEPNQTTDQYQSIIDNHDFNSQPLLFGRNINDVYVTNKTLKLPDNANIIVNGRIEPIASITRPLTQDFLVNTKRLYFDNSDFAVSEGMHIAVSDPTQPQHGGGSWKPQKIGVSDDVSSVVTSTYVEWNHNLDDRPQYTANGGYLVSNSAVIGVYHSIFTIDTKSNVTISGTGNIDMNHNEHFGKDYVCLRPNEIQESVNAACGISVKDSNNWSVTGITITDVPLHGIAAFSTVSPPYTRNTNFTIENVTFVRPSEKTIALLSCRNFVIRGNTTTDGVNEGDIICYQDCEDGLIENNTVSGSRRFGIAVLQTNARIIVRNNTIGNCGVADFYHVGNNTDQNHTFENFTFTTHVTSTGGNVSMINASNVDIGGTNTTVPNGGLYGVFGFTNCSDINVSNFTVTGNSTQGNINGVALDRVAACVNSSNITFTNCIFQDVKKIWEGSGNTNILMTGGEYGYRTNESNFPGLTLTNVYDRINDVYLNQSF